MFDPRLDNPPESVLRFLDQRSRRDHNGDVFFADETGLPILDLDRPGIPNADARAAARWTLKHRPDLWAQLESGNGIPAQPSTAAQPSYPAPSVGSLTGLSALMVRLKAGETVSQAEIDETYKRSMAKR